MKGAWGTARRNYLYCLGSVSSILELKLYQAERGQIGLIFTSSSSKDEVHGIEYGFGAHDYPASGVFEVEPKNCPGFIFRRSVCLGTTDMSSSEFRSFIEEFARKYHGDTYHLIIKNCNHFTDEVSRCLIGKPIPGWVNRLARLGSFFNFILPESIQVTAVRQLPVHPVYSEDGSDSYASSSREESDEEDEDHHLLKKRENDFGHGSDKPLRFA